VEIIIAFERILTLRRRKAKDGHLEIDKRDHMYREKDEAIMKKTHGGTIHTYTTIKIESRGQISRILNSS